MAGTMLLADASGWVSAISSAVAAILPIASGVASWHLGRRAQRRELAEAAQRSEAEQLAKQRDQAERVWAMWGNERAQSGDVEPGTWGAIVHNDSDSPVSYVHVTVRHRRDRWVSKDGLDTIAAHSSRKWAAHEVYDNVNGGLGPSALASDLLQSWQERGVHRVELTFRDHDKRYWLRDTNDELQELKSSFVVWADDERIDTCREHIRDEFVPKFGIDPTFEPYPSTEDLQDSFNEFARNPPAGTSVPDILIAPHDWLGGLLETGAVEAVQLTADQKGVFYQKAIDALSRDGQLFGIPYAFDAVALLTNVDLAGDGETPATFDELLAYGERLQAQHGLAAPIAIQLGSRGDPYHLWPLFSSVGGTLFGLRDDGTFAERSTWEEGFVDAFVEIAKLGARGGGAGAGPGRGVLRPDLDRTGAEELFTSGQTPYLIAACSRLGKARRRGVRVKSSLVPPLGDHAARSLVTVLAFYLLPQGHNLHIARDMASYYLARRKTAVELNLVQPWPPVQRDAADTVTTMTPALAAYVKSREGGLLMPSHPQMRKVWDLFGDAQVRAVQGSDDPRTVALELADRVQGLLGLS
jgi:arabinogalactan oligomer/maltooligosaccharide transport system substrate-binding protein